MDGLLGRSGGCGCLLLLPTLGLLLSQELLEVFTHPCADLPHHQLRGGKEEGGREGREGVLKNISLNVGLQNANLVVALKYVAAVRPSIFFLSFLSPLTPSSHPQSLDPQEMPVVIFSVCQTAHRGQQYFCIGHLEIDSEQYSDQEECPSGAPLTFCHVFFSTPSPHTQAFPCIC